MTVICKKSQVWDPVGITIKGIPAGLLWHGHRHYNSVAVDVCGCGIVIENKQSVEGTLPCFEDSRQNSPGVAVLLNSWVLIGPQDFDLATSAISASTFGCSVM